ncbi:MAG: FtsX-like permease family protein [Acidimicrobiales bacterium]
MNGEVVQLGWYRFRRTFERRWGEYLTLVLLIGLVGGLAMGSVAAARRTDSSFSVYWASTNPSDLVGGTGVLDASAGLKAYEAPIVEAISHLPHVARVESQSGINLLPLQPDGAPEQNVTEFSPGPGNGYGSVDGLYFDQDKVAVLAGHMADPDDPDQFMLSEAQAQAMGLHVGAVVRFGIYTNAQIQLRDFGSAAVKPYRVINARLVGIAAFNSVVIADQADQGSAPDNLFTPALTRPLLGCCVNYTESGARLQGGTRYVAAVLAEISRAFPKLPLSFSNVAAGVLPKAQRSLKPEAIALGAFGGIVALACLLIGAQLIGRQVRLGADERAILRAVGASPAQTWGDGLIGIFASVGAGAFLAVIVAVCLSPVAPLGPVRPVYPDPGVNFDWTVLGAGLGALVLVLGATAALVSYRGAPHRAARRALAPEQPSRILAAAGSAGLPAPALTGVRFALVPGHGRTSVPVRSAVVGAVLAVVTLVGTVTFGASLSSLVSHPALYGWNWDYLLGAGGDLPGPKVTGLLDHDRYVAAWSGVYTGSLNLDGQPVPVLGETPGATVAPALLSGHGVRAPDQVVLGALTLAQLHAHLDGTVVESAGAGGPHRLQVVGTATLPAYGGGSVQHLEMGVGAVLAYQLIPLIQRNSFNTPLPGPEAALVRLRPGVDRAAAYRSLVTIAQETTNPDNFGVSVIGVQRPAEILNYRSLGDTPVFLGAGLAAGALAALALTLIASVRRRRRDLAVLKTLGFTERQLAATVAWHSTTAVAIGVVAGVPLGIAVGRTLWDLFAHDINAVPAPSVPVGQVVLIALGALVVANVIAAIPGRLAARTPTALVLRSE